MGLSSDFNNVSSDSIPLLLIAAAAKWLSYLRSLLFFFLQLLGFSLKFDGEEMGINDYGLGSGLASLIALTEQKNKNRAFPYSSSCEGFESGCVVCMSKFVEGEEVRRLNCRHVFHKPCLDSWFDQLHMSCPLCRSPFVSEECTRAKERQITGDLVSWFSVA